MSRFVVDFMKDVLSENGHEQEICQLSVEVDAASQIEATQLAKQEFCRTQGLSDWSIHADRMQVKKGDFPSHGPNDTPLQARRGSLNRNIASLPIRLGRAE